MNTAVQIQETEITKREFRKALSWGGRGNPGLGSFYVNIPEEFVVALQIQPKTNLQMDLKDGRIIIENADADTYLSRSIDERDASR